VFSRNFYFGSCRQINMSAVLNILSFSTVYGENTGLIRIFERKPENNFAMHIFWIVYF